MSGTALKYLMMVLMVLDHIRYFVPREVWLVFHVASRCVAAFFAFMAVEGFIHTGSQIKYIRRLFVWAGLMFAGNTLLNEVIIRDAQYEVRNNIFLTLAFGVLILYLLEMSFHVARGAKRTAVLFCAAVLFLLAFFVAEGGFFIPIFMVITYSCRENKKLRNLLYCALSAFVFLLEFSLAEGPFTSFWDRLYYVNFLFIIFLPFAYLYNGKRGKATKFTKYSFYIFYPLHLWLIALIAWRLQA
ncbi:MAG: conjugal transfer protein TraX [Oscillospiraceae bacterium]|jgi:hypothetical protein|nr:conjugal transfer protein TraX [Oscillospiraceae bacterium]